MMMMIMITTTMNIDEDITFVTHGHRGDSLKNYHSIAKRTDI